MVSLFGNVDIFKANNVLNVLPTTSIAALVPLSLWFDQVVFATIVPILIYDVRLLKN